jgi:phospholipase/carboxylesterase
MLHALDGPEYAPPGGVVKRLVILLHGLGADGDDLIGLAPALATDLADTQFLAPNAPYPCDMAPYGYQWFSLRNWSFAAMEEAVRAVAPTLQQYIDEQRDRFALTDAEIALIGFSQGTMTGLYSALRRPRPLAGMVGFSGALIGAETLAEECLSRPPVCLIHGAMDPVVPFAAMGMAEAALNAARVPIETHTRPLLAHGIDPEGVAIATKFLRKCLGL